MKKLKIGIVGCGAMGITIALILNKRFKKSTEITAVTDIDETQAAILGKKLKIAKVVSLEELIRSSDLVVESASAKASFDIAKRALSGKKDVLIMSIGGVLGKEKKIYDIARQNKRRVYFPSGAICGLDGIKALSLAGIDEITLNTYKPSKALRGADYILKNNMELSDTLKEKLVFCGSAKEAVKAFPQNINVVALLSLAAGGTVVPRVKIFASGTLKRNIHVIDVKSKAAVLKIRCENVASQDNPKTSYLAILSAVTTITEILNFAKIGT